MVTTAFMQNALVVAHEEGRGIERVAQEITRYDQSTYVVKVCAVAQLIDEPHELKCVDHGVGHPLRRL